MMAPSTPFTKIWRVKNNGNIAWPSGSQLVWIGGDVLSKILSAEVEVRTFTLKRLYMYIYRYKFYCFG